MPALACDPDYAFQDRPQLCTQLSCHEARLGERVALIVWRQREYEAEWGDRDAAFPLGVEVLVFVDDGAGTTLADAKLIEELSGAGYRDVVQLEPAERSVEAKQTQSATITSWCRGYYQVPDDEASYVPSSECGTRQVVVTVDAATVDIRIR